MQKVLAGLVVAVLIFIGVNTFAEKETRTMLQVSNLSCGSCLSHIDTRLKEFSGYTGMAADLRRGLVAVDHQSSLESEKIAAAITGVGYPATIIPSGNVAGTQAQGPLIGNRSGYSCCGGGAGSGGCGAASGSWKRLFGFSSEDPGSSKNKP